MNVIKQQEEGWYVTVCGRESGVVREKSAITTPGSVGKYRH